MSIPVICDRCRSTGIAGENDFSHLGDLLDFAPVPVRPRVNGWDQDAQRAFIAALAVTGSKRRAAMSIGRNAFGIDQLLKRPGSDSFKAAVDRALAIAKQNGSMKIAAGVADAAARNAQLTPPSRLIGLPSPLAERGQGEGGIDEDQKLQLVEHLAGKFMKKVALERETRLNGEIVAADFYLRQITMIEIVFDLTASNFGWNAGEVLRDLRRGGQSLLDIVSTPFADWLDTRRRIWWLEEGAPERPPHPDPRFLRKHEAGPWGSRGGEGYSTYADDSGTGATTTPARGHTAEEWAGMSGDEQRLARKRQYDEDAAEQAEWERRAHAEFEARQNTLSLHGRGQG
jgi:hypothetical protein